MISKVFLGADHAGFKLKEAVKEKLREMNFEFEDLGTNSVESCDYPDFALSVCKKVVENSEYKGILICGTGAGMCVTANKVPGIMAVQVFSEHTAKQCVEHGNTNIICLGQNTVKEEDALKFVELFLTAEFQGNKPGKERYLRRLNKIKEIEETFLKKSLQKKAKAKKN